MQSIKAHVANRVRIPARDRVRRTRTDRNRNVSAGTLAIVIWNSALVSALSGMTYKEARDDPTWWGRLVENAFGAHLLNGLAAPRFAVGYWRELNDEIDYVVARGRLRVGFEVKSGRPDRPRAVDAFRRRFPGAQVVLVGGSGIPLEEAFSTPPERLIAG